MKNKIFRGANAVINTIFTVLIFTALYFALISPNLLLKSEHTNGVTLAMLAAILVFGLAFAYFQGFRTSLKRVLVTGRFYTGPAVFILAVIFQYCYALQVHPAIGFDVYAIHKALLDPANPDLRAYFSLNYNNLPILLFQHWLAGVFHIQSWAFFSLLSVTFTTLAALFILASVAVVNWRYLPIACYLQAVWLCLYPMSIVPYTDTWSLPWVALYIFAYLLMAKNRCPWPIRVLAAVLSCGALVGAYLIKPSSVIPMIGLILVSLLAMLKKHSGKFRLKAACYFLIMAAAFGIGLRQAETKISQQDYIQVNLNRKKPMIHFVQIGMTGNGGYSPKDDLAMGRLNSKKAKEEYSEKKIKRILHQRGISYLGFLVAKHGRNTADGTFSWGLEGHFFRDRADHQRIQHGLKSFVYPNGDNLDNFRFLAQLAWIVFVTLIAFGWTRQDWLSQALRLGLLGGFIFLLIFEGGRSRYLIQFLPAMMILGTLCTPAAVQKLRSLFSWLHD